MTRQNHTATQRRQITRGVGKLRNFRQIIRYVSMSRERHKIDRHVDCMKGNMKPHRPPMLCRTVTLLMALHGKAETGAFKFSR